MIKKTLLYTFSIQISVLLSDTAVGSKVVLLSLPLSSQYDLAQSFRLWSIRDGIMVSMSACHVSNGQFAGDRSSILRHGALFLLSETQIFTAYSQEWGPAFKSMEPHLNDENRLCVFSGVLLTDP